MDDKSSEGWADITPPSILFSCELNPLSKPRRPPMKTCVTNMNLYHLCGACPKRAFF